MDSSKRELGWKLHEGSRVLGYIVLTRELRRSLSIAQVLAAITLLRSIAFDRWPTVVAALLLIAGTIAAERGKTWGVALAFAVGMFFPVAFLIGIAPVWFVAVGLAAAWPFMQVWRGLARVDRGAAMLLAGLATTFGAGGAVAWKALSWPLIKLFPALAPGIYPQHGFALVATLAVIAAFVIAKRRRLRAEAPTGVRIATPSPVAASYDDRYETEEAAMFEQSSLGARRASR